MSIGRRKPYKRPASEDQTKLGTTWADVEGMIRQRAFPKWAGFILVALVVVVTVLAGFGIYNQNRINNLASESNALVQQVKAGALASCEAGNRSRNTNKQIWDDFLNLIITNPQAARTRKELLAEVQQLDLPSGTRQAVNAIIVSNWTINPNNIKIVTAFEDYIAAHEYAVDCAKAYR